MKSAPLTLVALLSGILLMGCSDSAPADSPGEAPAVDVPTFSSGLDPQRLLSSLDGDEISDACEQLFPVVTAADAELACRVVAAGESNTSDECAESVRDCLPEPSSALSQTTLRSTPGPIDCEEFTADLVEECEFPVSLLEDCVNALAQGVVPGAEAVPCSDAAEFKDIAAAEQVASENRDTAYTEICFDLLECEALVSVLLGGK